MTQRRRGRGSRKREKKGKESTKNIVARRKDTVKNMDAKRKKKNCTKTGLGGKGRSGGGSARLKKETAKNAKFRKITEGEERKRDNRTKKLKQKKKRNHQGEGRAGVGVYRY